MLQWGEDEEEELDEITENLTAATNTLKSLREFKSQVVNVIHATRANVDSTSRRDSQSCCKVTATDENIEINQSVPDMYCPILERPLERPIGLITLHEV